LKWSEEGPEKNLILLQSFDGIKSNIAQAEAWVILRKILSGMPTDNTREDLFLASRGIVRDAPEIPINPQHLGMFLDLNTEVLNHYPPLADAVVEGWRKASASGQEVVDTVKSIVDNKIERKMEEIEGAQS
jgi:hypothetical protein